jgi:aspartyl-tRNA(Asn)/glutamyl-tRNA(Gln) amidotransferase subunit C
MKIDRELVLHIAELAHIELRDEDLDRFTKQLQDILVYVEQLNEVRQPAEPFSYVDFLPTFLRADKPVPSLPVDEALRNAPARVKDFFKVPRILP